MLKIISTEETTRISGGYTESLYYWFTYWLNHYEHRYAHQRDEACYHDRVWSG